MVRGVRQQLVKSSTVLVIYFRLISVHTSSVSRPPKPAGTLTQRMVEADAGEAATAPPATIISRAVSTTVPRAARLRRLGGSPELGSRIVLNHFLLPRCVSLDLRVALSRTSSPGRAGTTGQALTGQRRGSRHNPGR